MPRIAMQEDPEINLQLRSYCPSWEHNREPLSGIRDIDLYLNEKERYGSVRTGRVPVPQKTIKEGYHV